MNDDSWFPKVSPPGKSGADDYIVNGLRLWKSKDERLTKLSDMGSDHIHACINKIERNLSWRTEWVEWFKMELAYREIIKASLGLTSGHRVTPEIRKRYEDRWGALPEQRIKSPVVCAWDFASLNAGPSSSEVERRRQKEERFRLMYGGRPTFHTMYGIDGAPYHGPTPTA